MDLNDCRICKSSAYLGKVYFLVEERPYEWEIFCSNYMCRNYYNSPRFLRFKHKPEAILIWNKENAKSKAV